MLLASVAICPGVWIPGGSRWAVQGSYKACSFHTKGLKLRSLKLPPGKSMYTITGAYTDEWKEKNLSVLKRRGEGEVWINRETGIDIYTLLYIKWIMNKDLL